VGVSNPDDVELARAFERGEISNAGFHHASHLRVAWVYLNEHASVDEATTAIAETIRAFAVSVGKAEKFDLGVTAFWMQALAGARDAMPGATLDEILRARPELLDKNLPKGTTAACRL
jgi:hypothetical protein